MLGGNNTCSEKLFDGLFVAVSHCDLYDIVAIFLGCLLSLWLKQLFHYVTMFFSQELGKALPGQGISAPRGCLHWGCRVRSGMTCPHDWPSRCWLWTLAPLCVGLSVGCSGFLTAWWLGSKSQCSQRPIWKPKGSCRPRQGSHMASPPLHAISHTCH